VTYPENQVAECLNTYFVPVQVDIEKVGKLAAQYQALWTPNLNVINGREERVYHIIGWLPPSELTATLHAARGHYLLSRKKFDEAAAAFESLVDMFPRSVVAPESIYYTGVARYLSSHDAQDLKNAWRDLQDRYPNTEWALKSHVL
jgi:tetratricopeptide (TPR) repeat protein